MFRPAPALDRPLRLAIDGRPVRYPLAGVGQYVANLSEALSDLRPRDLSATILLFDGWRSRNEDALRLAGRLRNVRPAIRRLLPRRVCTALLRYADRTLPSAMLGGPFDVWHSTFFEAWPRLQRDQRLVSTIHDLIFVTRPELFATRNLSASRSALGRQAEESDEIITVSDYTRQQLLAHTAAAPERVTAIPLAVRTSPLAEDEIAKHMTALGITRPFVLYVGNLEPRKDVPTLLRAWAMSHARHDYALVLAGAAAYLSDAAVTAVRQSTGDVRWLGYVSQDQKTSLLSMARAFVYPSVYEGFGIPVLEALTHGLPVVACNTSSIPEVAGPGALLVPPSAPEEMSAAIDRLLGTDTLHAKLSRLGREHAAGYSWQRTATETLHIYRRAAQRDPRGPQPYDC